MTLRYWGCHVSAAGGYGKALERGNALGVTAIQIHPSAPQKWNSKPYLPDVENEYLTVIESSPGSVKKIFFHGIYLINLATPDRSKWHLGKLSLLHDLQLAERMHASGVIFHVGSLKDEPDEEVGLERCAEGIKWILDEYEGTVPLLLEVSAGSGKVIGSKLEQLAIIDQKVNAPERIGFALDTQHLWASGYDLVSAQDAFIGTIRTTIGHSRIGLIHLNDSKTACGSATDRHANLGEGLIGLEALTQFVRRDEFSTIPLILETPRMKSADEAAIEVGVVREMLAA